MTTGVFQKPEDESFWQELVRRIRTTMKPDRALLGLGVAKDIIVYTPDEVEDWKTASCSLAATVLREGKVARMSRWVVQRSRSSQESVDGYSDCTP